MVAAAGATEGIKPQVGLALIATVLVGLVAHMFLADRYRIQNLTPLEKSPDVLLARSQEINVVLRLRPGPRRRASKFEPFVRRRDPHTLIGWVRLTSGKIRDPLVGRDILIGTAYGVLPS